mgnify:CR=1 FL=1
MTPCAPLQKMLIQSLSDKYHSDISASKATISIYLHNSVGIGEHPQHLEEIDKLLENIANAEDKLNSLEKYFKEYSDNISE